MELLIAWEIALTLLIDNYVTQLFWCHKKNNFICRYNVIRTQFNNKKQFNQLKKYVIKIKSVKFLQNRINFNNNKVTQPRAETMKMVLHYYTLPTYTQTHTHTHVSVLVEKLKLFYMTYLALVATVLCYFFCVIMIELK